MALLLNILILAVAFATQAAASKKQEQLLDVNNAFSHLVKNKGFENNLNKHIENIERVHKPYLDELAKLGCKFNVNQSPLEPSNFNPEACVNLTSTIASVERLVLDSYYILNDYRKLTIEGVKNVTICLQGEQGYTDLWICLLTAVQDYGTEVGKLNLQFVVILNDDKKLKKDIYDYFEKCFGVRPNQLKTMAQHYAKRFCDH